MQCHRQYEVYGFLLPFRTKFLPLDAKSSPLGILDMACFECHVEEFMQGLMSDEVCVAEEIRCTLQAKRLTINRDHILRDRWKDQTEARELLRRDILFRHHG